MSLAFCLCGKIKGQCACKKTGHDKTTTQRGYGYDWQQVSKRYRKANPLCVRCLELGRVTPTEHVHHVVPIKDNDALRLNPVNFMAVCEPCHRAVENNE